MLALLFFFFNDTATTEIYTLSLHDALPIYAENAEFLPQGAPRVTGRAAIRSAWAQMLTAPNVSLTTETLGAVRDRKSTRLNSSHSQISYAVFCLKKKKKRTNTIASLQSKRQ